MMSYALIILVLVIQCGQFTAGSVSYSSQSPKGCT